MANGSVRLGELIDKGEDHFVVACEPCKRTMPEVDRFAALNPDITVIKVNVDIERALTNEWEVRTIPMMIYVPVDGAPRAILGFTRAEEIARKIAG